MSDRIFSAVWLFVCIAIAALMYKLEVPFAYEPVGPKVFPIILALLMAACCVALFIRPDVDVVWPAPAVLGKSALLVLSLLFYALFFTRLGFPLATILMVLAVSRLFGASWKSACISAVLIGLLGFLVFDKALDVALPLGQFWSFGGSHG